MCSGLIKCFSHDSVPKTTPTKFLVSLVKNHLKLFLLSLFFEVVHVTSICTFPLVLSPPPKASPLSPLHVCPVGYSWIADFGLLSITWVGRHGGAHTSRKLDVFQDGVEGLAIPDLAQNQNLGNLGFGLGQPFFSKKKTKKLLGWIRIGMFGPTNE